NSELHVAMRIVDGSFMKFHLFKVTNNGDTWTDLGDLTPGIDGNITRCQGPENVDDIPNNTPFVVMASDDSYNGATGVEADIYALPCSFGEASSVAATETTALESITDLE